MSTILKSPIQVLLKELEKKLNKPFKKSRSKQMQGYQLLNRITTSSKASEIVFGSIISSIKDDMQVVKQKPDLKEGGSSGTKDFVTFVVGGSTKDKPISIVEIEDDPVTNN